MPNITPIQSNFSVGEIATDMQMRSTLEARQNSVRTLTNFLPDAHGPVSRRKGFRFLGKVGVASDFPLLCGEAVAYEKSDETDANGAVYTMTQHPGDILVITKRGGAGGRGKILSYNTLTDTWTQVSQIGVDNGEMSHIAGSGVGSTGDNTFIYNLRQAPTGHEIYRYQLVLGSWQFAGASPNLGTRNNPSIYTESINRIAYLSDSLGISAHTLPKDLANDERDLTRPAGWTIQYVMWSNTRNQWMVLIQDNLDVGLVFVDENFDGTFGTPDYRFSFSNVHTSDWNPRVFSQDASGQFYVNFGSAGLASELGSAFNNFIMRLDNSGIEQEIYTQETIGADPLAFMSMSSESAEGGLSYTALTNRMTASTGGLVVQYDIDTNTWSTCQVAGVSGDTKGARVTSDGKMWGTEMDALLPTMVEHEIYG